MIKTDKFGKRKSYKLMFFAFFIILTMKISSYYETMFGV